MVRVDDERLRRPLGPPHVILMKRHVGLAHVGRAAAASPRVDARAAAAASKKTAAAAAAALLARGALAALVL